MRGRRFSRRAAMLQSRKSAAYVYNADGIRETKQVTVGGSTTTHTYVTQNGKVVRETIGSGSTAKVLDFIYDESGRPFALIYKNGTATAQTYCYVLNLQGDVVKLIWYIPGFEYQEMAAYIYDAWGNILTATGTMAQINPLRYRGYYYDTETGLYYVSSRYYDPEVGRYLNADGYVSTGQGILGNNMFAYCGNNPVNNCDPSGQFFISALLVGGLVLGSALLLSGCSAKPEPKPEPYKSADDAARAFSEQVYSSSAYIRHEYSTEIYSRTVKGETTYNYNPPRAGKPHSASVGNSTPKGTKAVAYAHTHPNSNVFSGADIRAAENLKIDAYVVGPNLELQRYSLSSASTTNIGGISPIALTDAQRSSLVTEFKVSWDAHIAAGCDFDCGSMTWPTP